MRVRRPVFLGQCGDLLTEIDPVRVGVRVAGVLEVVVGCETDTDAVGADGGCHRPDDLEREAAAVGDAAAVAVCADVDVVVEELVEKIAVCACSYWLEGN